MVELLNIEIGSEKEMNKKVYRNTLDFVLASVPQMSFIQICIFGSLSFFALILVYFAY